jgi:hypothetical protein
MSTERELRSALQRIQAPDELDGQRRAWPIVHAAFRERESVQPAGRSLRPLLVAAAGVAILAAALTPPGRALVGSVRDAFDEETVKPRPALTSLPANGPLLVNARRGPWIVRFDGSKRFLGNYEAGSWSPNARYVVVTRGHQLTALDWSGKPEPRWSIARNRAVHGARWSPEVNPGDTRVAYLNGRELRIVGGDGKGDRPLRKLVAATAPAWRPRAGFELSFATVDNRIELIDTESAKTVWRTIPGEPPTQLLWSEDGERLLVLSENSLRVLDSKGRRLLALRLPIGPSGVAFTREGHNFVMIRYSPATGRSDLVLLQAEANPGEPRFLYSAPGDFGTLAVSPNGNWLLVGWVNADQWLFLRLRPAKVIAVSGIVEQFGGETRTGPLSEAFPASVSWCCPASP